MSSERAPARRFLDRGVLDAFSTEAFASRRPSPWSGIEQLLEPAAFEALCANFPPLSLFAWHEGRPRVHDQRPQARWYLAYEASPYENYAGVASHAQLPEVWQDFIDELRGDESYRGLMARSLGRDDLVVRFAWHVAVRGCEVCPHLDDPNKAGTHIFYFNTRDDWRDDWGATVMLEGKRTPRMNPDFAEFEAAYPVQTVGNRSFLFKNTADAWHGVEPLTCPEGNHRRLFNVIFEHPDARQPVRSSIWDRVRSRWAGQSRQ